MNAVSPIEAALPRATFEAAREAAAAWRGRCIDAFARSEAAVTEALLVLASVGERTPVPKLPHLVGQRYDTQVNAVGATGAFASEGKPAVMPIADFRKHDALRTQLSHGIFTVTLDHRGQWYLVARVLAIRTGRGTRDLLVVGMRLDFQATEGSPTAIPPPKPLEWGNGAYMSSRSACEREWDFAAVQKSSV